MSYMQRHLGDKNLRMRHHYLGGSGTKPVALALRVSMVIMPPPSGSGDILFYPMHPSV